MAAKKAATGSSKPKVTAKKSVSVGSKATQPAGSVPKKSVSKSKAPTAAVIAPTTEEISLRAFQIWEAKGKPIGMDEINWKEAEAQLKRERGL